MRRFSPIDLGDHEEQLGNGIAILVFERTAKGSGLWAASVKVEGQTKAIAFGAHPFECYATALEIAKLFLGTSSRPNPTALKAQSGPEREEKAQERQKRIGQASPRAKPTARLAAHHKQANHTSSQRNHPAILGAYPTIRNEGLLLSYSQSLPASFAATSRSPNTVRLAAGTSSRVSRR